MIYYHTAALLMHSATLTSPTFHIPANKYTSFVRDEWWHSHRPHFGFHYTSRKLDNIMMLVSVHLTFVLWFQVNYFNPFLYVFYLPRIIFRSLNRRDIFLNMLQPSPFHWLHTQFFFDKIGQIEKTIWQYQGSFLHKFHSAVLNYCLKQVPIVST